MNTDTYQIKSKYGGRCTVCGNYIKQGTIVDWTPNEGIRHVKPCVSSEAAIVERQTERETQAATVGRVNIMELAQ